MFFIVIVSLKKSSIIFICSANSMDFDGAPSRFLDYDVNMSMTLSLLRTLTVHKWYNRWSRRDNSLLIGSEIGEVFLSATHLSNGKTHRGSSKTERRPQLPATHGARSVRRESTKQADLQYTFTSAVSYGIQQQQQATAQAKNEAFSTAQEPAAGSSSVDKNGQGVSPITSIEQNLAGDGEADLIRNAETRPLGTSQSVIARQLQHQRRNATDDKQQTWFSLPRRIYVSKREINMMSSLSF